MTFGSTANLIAKARGDSSMHVKRKKSEDAYDEVPQEPRDKVRAKLPNARGNAPHFRGILRTAV